MDTSTSSAQYHPLPVVPSMPQSSSSSSPYNLSQQQKAQPTIVSSSSSTTSASKISNPAATNETNSPAAEYNNDDCVIVHKTTKTSLLDQASRELSESLIDDLPLLMYGSGDVYPYRQRTKRSSNSSNSNNSEQQNKNYNNETILEYQTNLKTASLLSHLTTTYIQNLVHAAIDSHDLFTDGKSGNGGGIIPSYELQNQPRKRKYDCIYQNENERKRQLVNSLRGSSGNSSGGNTSSGITGGSQSRQQQQPKTPSISEWEDELPIPIITSQKQTKDCNK